MKRNLRFEMEFPISTFLLSILAKNNSTDIVELNGMVLQTVRILKLKLI